MKLIKLFFCFSFVFTSSFSYSKPTYEVSVGDRVKIVKNDFEKIFENISRAKNFINSTSVIIDPSSNNSGCGPAISAISNYSFNTKIKSTSSIIVYNTKNEFLNNVVAAEVTSGSNKCRKLNNGSNSLMLSCGLPGQQLAMVRGLGNLTDKVVKSKSSVEIDVEALHPGSHIIRVISSSSLNDGSECYVNGFDDYKVVSSLPTCNFNSDNVTVDFGAIEMPKLSDVKVLEKPFGLSLNCNKFVKSIEWTFSGAGGYGANGKFLKTNLDNVLISLVDKNKKELIPNNKINSNINEAIIKLIIEGRERIGGLSNEIKSEINVTVNYT